MKKILYSICTVSAGALLLLSSCTKKIDEAYTNPNATVRVPIETLLPGIIGNFVGNSSAAGSGYGVANDGLYIGRYIQNWATNSTGNQFDQMGGATTSSDLLGSVWAMHYFGMGGNLNKMIEWGTEEKKWDYVGVGYAIRAWSWLTLTNVYGEAILREAFRPEQLVFNYDPQPDIYAEVRRIARLAIENLEKTGDGVSQANLALGDAYFYNGDVNKWKKFVYAVMARSFNHLTNKTIYQPDSVLFYCNLAINSNVDNAAAKFLASGLSGTYNFYSPFRQNAVGALRQTKFVADLMTGINPMFLTVVDPRTPYIIRENTNGTYKGIVPNKGSSSLATADQPFGFWGQPFTSTTAPPTDNNCRYIFRNAAPFPISTAAEVQFMKAEALLRQGANPVLVRQAYIDGISLSFDMLTGTPDYHNSVPPAMQITPAMKAAYLANPIVTPALITRSHIMLQKYIAMYGWGVVETWTDMRRYHYTDLDPVTGQQVYNGFTPPTGIDLFTTNNGKLVYRARPRFNSEFLYNIAALDLLGARALDYNTKEQWFSQP